MAIIISKNGKNAKKLEKETIQKEDYLQKYIYDNPESIPIYEISADIKVLLLGREIRTESGRIDAFGIDRKGDIYLIETKLYKNPDKRLVVAQVLDYGASLWKHSTDFESFLDYFEQECMNKFNITLQQRIQSYFDINVEEIEFALENFKKNLGEGNFKFIVLMDQLHSNLKDLILYINKNSKFDIYAVELEYYKFNEYEILIPKLFGTEVKKEVGESQKRKSASAEEILKLAENYNISNEFRKIHEAAMDLDLYARTYQYSIMYTHMSNKSRMLFTVQPGIKCLYLWTSSKAFSEYYSVDEAKVISAIGKDNPNGTKLEGKQIDDFIKGLREILT